MSVESLDDLDPDPAVISEWPEDFFLDVELELLEFRVELKSKKKKIFLQIFESKPSLLFSSWSSIFEEKEDEYHNESHRWWIKII